MVVANITKIVIHTTVTPMCSPGFGFRVILSDINKLFSPISRYFDIRDKNQEKRGFDDVLRRSIDANGALIISDYVPYLSFITKLQGWEAYLLGLQRRGREMVAKIIEVDKHKQRAEGVTKDESSVPDMVDVLLKAPLDDTGKPLSDGEIASLLLVSIPL